MHGTDLSTPISTKGSNYIHISWHNIYQDLLIIHYFNQFKLKTLNSDHLMTKRKSLPVLVMDRQRIDFEVADDALLVPFSSLALVELTSLAGKTAFNSFLDSYSFA